MNSVLKALAEIDDSRDYVIAIITDTKGSTYRKSGAMMLVSDDLTYHGLLSGGCLEGDVVEHCKKVFENQVDTEIHYNLRGDDDWLWGMGLGCDGEINVLLKYLPANQKHHGLINMLFQIDAGKSQYLLIDESNDVLIQSTQPESNRYKFQKLYEAPHHLLICGASPDVPPITSIANQIGWKTTVIDHRTNSLNKTRFSNADHLTHVKTSKWPEYDLSNYDSVIIMSHQYEKDREYLRHLIKSSIAYIGLLGPSKRRDKLLEECGVSFDTLKGRLFAPIGLDLGAGSPEEIALAIVSEIQAVRNKKTSQNSIPFCFQDDKR